MKWQKVAIAGAVLFIAGFLSGFIPQYQDALKFAAQLKSLQLQSKLREIRELAALSYIDVSKMNYGSAAEDSEGMFNVAKEVAKDTKDDGLRNSLMGLLAFRDAVKGKLSAGDASVLESLQQIVQKTQTELKH